MTAVLVDRKKFSYELEIPEYRPNIQIHDYLKANVPYHVSTLLTFVFDEWEVENEVGRYREI